MKTNPGGLQGRGGGGEEEGVASAQRELTFAELFRDR